MSQNTSITREYNAGTGNSQEAIYFTPKPELSEEQAGERSFDLYRLFQISQVRESAHPQFDGAGYSRYNETNEQADISYLAPKKNKGDSRITTGVTHEKDSSLVSFFLNLSFEGSVRVFYKDQEVEDLGTALTRLVRKSREEEDYDGKRPMNYRNYVAQGTSFVVEEYIETWVPDKVITSNVESTALDQVKWIDKGFKKVNHGCVSTLIDGKKVFLENIRERDIQKQPGVYTVEYIPREAMRSIWKDTKMWEFVPFNVTPTATGYGTLTQGSIYSDWVFGEVDFTKCEVIKVYRPLEQRFQIYINGVPMLPPGFPLKAVSPSGLIPISKADLDSMNMFAYSKSEPAKTKIDQAVYDEHLQNMILKSRQSAAIPRVNNTGKLVTPDMFLGGRFVHNVDPENLKPLIDPAHVGITSSDFSFYQLFKQQIDNKTISSMLEGNAGGDKVETLGQYMDMQKKQMLKIGGKIDGIVQWEKQMLKLRVANLLAHGYKKDEQGNYKDVSIQDIMPDGTQGTAITKFTESNYVTPGEVFDMQNKYKEATGKNVQYTFLNPMLMKKMIDDPDFYICYEVVPVDKNNDKLTQLMFVSLITQATQLFGPDSLNVAKLKKQYASIMGKPFEDVFLPEEELQAKREQAQAQALEAAKQGVKPEGSKAAIKSPLNVQVNASDLLK